MKKDKVKNLQVKFSDAVAGCLPIQLKAGNKKYVDCFSCYWDPLPDLKHWLEAIVIGVEQTSFTYDNEGQNIKFDAQSLWIDREKKYLFTITWIEGNRVEFQVVVDRKQMIGAFFNGFVKYFKSDKYNPLEWEFHAIHDKLYNLLALDYEQLVDYCAKLNTQELTALLERIDDVRGVLWVDDYVSKDYNKKTFEDKREQIKKMLKQNANPYEGMSLANFRSEIIEKYLKENEL